MSLLPNTIISDFLPARVITWKSATSLRREYSILPSLRPVRSESSKHVLLQSRTSVSLYNTIHILPVLICAALISLNVYTLFVNAPKTWIPLLQIAAKVHETLMQASIAAIALDYMRSLLLKEEVVPFGAIFPAVSTNSFSSLWSTELWAASSAKCFGGRKKAVFLALIPFSVLLAAVVGPSSAIAMVPRNVDFSLGQAITLLNASRDAITPSHFTEAMVNSNCSSRVIATEMGYIDCPAVNLDAVSNIIDFVTPISNGLSLSNFNALWGYDLEKYFNTDKALPALITADPYLQTDALKQIAMIWWLYQHSVPGTEPLTTTGLIQKPLVSVSCHDEWANQTDPYFDFTFGDDGVRAKRPAVLLSQIASVIQRPSRGDIFWLEPESAMASNVSLLAAVITPRKTDPKKDEIDTFCAVKAWWTETEVEVSNLNFNEGQTIAPTQEAMIRLWQSNANRSVIKLDPAWAKYLLPLGDTKPSPEQQISDINTMDYKNTGVMDSYIARLVTMGIVNYQAVPDPESLPRVAVPSALYDPLMEDANTTWGITTATGYLFQDMPRGFGAGLTDGQTTVQEQQNGLFDNATWHEKFTFKTKFSVKGLAYSLDGVPIKLSIAVLGIYMLFATLYVAYSTRRGLSSSAWTSVSELVGLALNSQRPTVLENTSAGIDAHTTFQQPVCVRERDGHGVQFVFRKDLEGQRELYKHVQVNKLY